MPERAGILKDGLGSRGNTTTMRLIRTRRVTVPTRTSSQATCGRERRQHGPPEQVKGDIARALFYMAIRYTGDRTNEPLLLLTDRTSEIVSGATLMGRYTTLLKWHMADPVRLLRAPRMQRRRMMNREERDQLGRLPAQLRIYRGFSHPGGERGLSWTLSRECAEFFADYANSSRRAYLAKMRPGRKFVAAANCKRRDVIAYFQVRKEGEVVILPAHISLIEIQELL